MKTIISLFIFLLCSCYVNNAQNLTPKQAQQVRMQQTVGQVLIAPGVLFMFKGVQEARAWGKGAENSFLPAFAIIASAAFLMQYEEPLDIRTEFNTDVNPYFWLDHEWAVNIYVSRLALLWSFEYYPPEAFYLMSSGLGVIIVEKDKFNSEAGAKFGFNGRGLAGTVYLKESYQLSNRLSAVLYERYCSHFRDNYIEARIGIQYRLLN